MKSNIIDKFQIFGFAVSTCVSITLIMLGKDTVGSVTFGLVLASLTQLFDLQLRHASTEARILQANALSKELYQNPWLLAHIQEIINDYTKVKNGWFDGFKTRSDSALKECHDLIHLLAEGKMIVEKRSPFSFGSQAIKTARISLQAVTLSDGTFWTSIHGDGYLQANIEAIQRGVQLTRIFLNSKDKLISMTHIMQKHKDAGIKVYVALTDNVPKNLREDVIIMDEKLFNRAEFAPDGSIKQWEMSINPKEVEEMIKTYQAILRVARSLDDVMANPQAPITL